jgi:uncharacterized protein YprB with RNaseH-like and TPR domain
MLSDETRARLARLHQTATVAPSRELVASTPFVANARDLFEQGDECSNGSGRHWRLRRRLCDVWPDVERHATGCYGLGALGILHAELAALAECWPRSALFVDLETCGFAGSMVFLVGLVWHVDGTLAIDQLVARNYGEERALLETLWQVAARNRVLVTFNGKSFDWPMVHDRSTRHHLGRRMAAAHPAATARDPFPDGLGRHDVRPELVHCDLLHHARRRWKHVLPDCRLQTLERYVCRRSRRNDLPGALVPAAYHQFVRTGNTAALAHILSHNALDLATLVQLGCALLAGDSAAEARRSLRSAG